MYTERVKAECFGAMVTTDAHNSQLLCLIAHYSFKLSSMSLKVLEKMTFINRTCRVKQWCFNPTSDASTQVMCATACPVQSWSFCGGQKEARSKLKVLLLSVVYYNKALVGATSSSLSKYTIRNHQPNRVLSQLNQDSKVSRLSFSEPWKTRLRRQGRQIRGQYREKAQHGGEKTEQGWTETQHFGEETRALQFLGDEFGQ